MKVVYHHRDKAGFAGVQALGDGVRGVAQLAGDAHHQLTVFLRYPALIGKGAGNHGA
ncbi:hypothetical protein D3C78_1800700 [compost metagenome]